MEKISKVQAVKRFFEREDTISPSGGRKVGMPEFQALGSSGLSELAQLCAAELGVELS